MIGSDAIILSAALTMVSSNWLAILCATAIGAVTFSSTVWLDPARTPDHIPPSPRPTFRHTATVDAPARMGIPWQLDRLDAVITSAATSARDAQRAHVAASGLLDNAEYQIAELLEEYGALLLKTAQSPSGSNKAEGLIV